MEYIKRSEKIEFVAHISKLIVNIISVLIATSILCQGQLSHLWHTTIFVAFVSHRSLSMRKDFAFYVNNRYLFTVNLTD